MIVKTRVEFRVNKDDEVIAVFTHQVNDRNGLVGCYQHIGQHGEADPVYISKYTRPATAQEYAPLFKELTEVIGYDLKVLPVS